MILTAEAKSLLTFIKLIDLLVRMPALRCSFVSLLISFRAATFWQKAENAKKHINMQLQWQQAAAEDFKQAAVS